MDKELQLILNASIVSSVIDFFFMVNYLQVVLHNVPLEITECEIESAVRNAAIALRFSPPNFVKLLPQSVPQRTAGTRASCFLRMQYFFLQ